MTEDLVRSRATFFTFRISDRLRRKSSASYLFFVACSLTFADCGRRRVCLLTLQIALPISSVGEDQCGIERRKKCRSTMFHGPGR